MLTVYSKEQDEKNNKGIWVDFKGSQLRIARWLNIQFIGEFLTESMEALTPDSEEFSLENIEVKKDIFSKYHLMCKAMAGTILTDWKNVLNEETGEEVGFTPEYAEILLRNNVEVHNFVKETSQKVENFETNKEEKVLGE